MQKLNPRPKVKTYYDSDGKRQTVKVLSWRQRERCEHEFRKRALNEITGRGEFTLVCTKCGCSAREGEPRADLAAQEGHGQSTATQPDAMGRRRQPRILEARLRD